MIVLIFRNRYAGEDGDPGLLDDMHEQLRLTIQKTFGVSSELAGRLLLELLQCVKRKNLVSPYDATFVVSNQSCGDFGLAT